VPDDRLYFRQLLAGRDFARDDRIARQMVNFVYAIGDRQTGEAVVVDPAWAPAELVDLVAADGMRLVGALATHYHMDHIGGAMMGHPVAGIAELLEVVGLKVHVQRDEAEFVKKTTGVGDADLAVHDAGEVLMVGEIPIELIHTPGHTPGSQCFLVEGCLVAGDTLFLEGCGRTDFPGSDAAAMYDSLHLTLARVPDEAVLYPGHFYAMDPSATMGETRRSNYVLMPRAKSQWLMMFGSG
jgi:glyoxylase-like metal-dependent hydrolase (beta-lactamase superfamily II)